MVFGIKINTSIVSGHILYFHFTIWTLEVEAGFGLGLLDNRLRIKGKINC